MIERTDERGVAIVRMCREPANILTSEFGAALRDALSEAREDDVRAVVLTGTGTAFSAGVDLFRVLDEGPDYIDAFMPILGELFAVLRTYPKPLVAALNGHAIAGGAVMAWACDYRVMAAGGGRIGVPELKVGVPFPAIALEIVRDAVPASYRREVILLGGTYGPEDAKARGLVDEVVPPEQVLPRAIAIALDLAGIPAATYALSKRQLARSPGTLSELEEEVRALWRAPETHAHIREYLERTLGKSSGRPQADDPKESGGRDAT